MAAVEHGKSLACHLFETKHVCMHVVLWSCNHIYTTSPTAEPLLRSARHLGACTCSNLCRLPLQEQLFLDFVPTDAPLFVPWLA